MSAAPTRDQQRSRRARPVRAKTLNVRNFSKHALELGRLLYPPTGEPRPRVRGECVGGPRPCPWAGCRHHLALEVDPGNGSIKLNFPDVEVEEMVESCSLDVADRGPLGQRQVGALLNVVRERARQIEQRAHEKVRLASRHLPVLVDEDDREEVPDAAE